MTPERNERLWAIHDEVCHLPPEQWDALLEQRCGDDQELRALALRLLQARETMGLDDLPERCRVNVRDMLQGFSSQEPIPPLPSPDEDTDTADRPRIPGYEILGVLGRGGMGVVYRARDTRLGRVVALKMISPPDSFDPALLAELLARFPREAEAVARLHHPHIVQVFEVGEVDGLPFMALELVEGSDLAQKWANQPQTPRSAVEVVETLARAIHAAHCRQVIHRDLKPQNVLLDAAGVAKIADFGLARQADQQGRTLSGAILGTPSYMAPEQAQGKTVGPLADVYALGAILYEGLTGRPPFKAATSIETLQQVIADEPVPPRLLNAGVPRDLETICLKCLQKDPARRYATALELADDLRRWQAGEPIVARPVGLVERAVKWVRRRPLIAALSAAVAVAMVAGTTVSVAFGVHAGKKEQEAVEKEQKAQAALQAVEESLAVGLLRPLGHFKDTEALTDFELAALEDLACLPQTHDRVRLLFIGRALRKPETAGQLGRRLEESLIAAVGLRQDLRQRTMQDAAKCLEDAGTPREVKVVCARLLIQLRCPPDRWAVDAGDTLVAEMTGEIDLRSRDTLSAAFLLLADKLSGEQAAMLASRIVERAARTNGSFPLRDLSRAFAALAGKLPADQAGKHAATLAGRIVEQLAARPADTTALSDGLAALARQIPAERAATLADQLVKQAARMTQPFHRHPQLGAFKALADKVSVRQASVLMGRIVEQTDRTTNPHALRPLVELCAALADKLPADLVRKQTVALEARLVELADKTTNPQPLRALSRAFAALAGKRPSDQAATLAGRIVELAGKTTFSNSLAAFSDALAALADKVPVDRAGALAGRIVELAGKTTDPSSLDSLSAALAALAGKLPADQVFTVAGRIVELIARPVHRDYLPPLFPFFLGNAFTALAGKLSAEQASVLAVRIVALAGKTTDLDSQVNLWNSFVALSGKLPADRAVALAGRIVELASTTTDPGSVAGLSRGFASLSGKLSPEQAATLAARIVEQAARSTFPASRTALSMCLTALVGKLSGQQAASLADRTVALVAGMTHANNLGALAEALAALADALTVLAGKLSPEQASALASRIVELAGKTSYPDSLRTLAVAFAALAGKLPADQAGKHAATVAGRIVGLIQRKPPEPVWSSPSTNPYALAVLAEAFGALPGKVPAEQASPVADQIVLLSATIAFPPALFRLAQAFAALPGKRREEQVAALVLRVTRLAHRDRTFKAGKWPLDRLLPQVSTQTLVEALKQPGCVGTMRSTLLWHLGQRNDRSFSDVWQLADHLKEHSPDIDLEAPLRPTTSISQPAQR